MPYLLRRTAATSDGAYRRARRPLLVMVLAAALFALGIAGPGALRALAVSAAGSGSVGDPNIDYVGRWSVDSDSAVPNWTGTYLRTAFTGTTVKVVGGDAVNFYASIDGGPDVFYAGVRGTVDLTPTPLDAGEHTLRVEYRSGDTVFHGLQLDDGASTVAPEPAGGLVEFVGDSITAGYLTDRLALDSYGWKTGELLGMEHTQIARAGYCLVPKDGCTGLATQFFKTGSTGDDDWDFSRYSASAVVINLGTNDVGHTVTDAEFQSAYTQLLAGVRAKYPDAALFVMQTFKQRYLSATKAAVDARNQAGDGRVQYVDTTGWLTVPDDYEDTDGHPNESGHTKIAQRLAPIISGALGTNGALRADGASAGGAGQTAAVAGSGAPAAGAAAAGVGATGARAAVAGASGTAAGSRAASAGAHSVGAGTSAGAGAGAGRAGAADDGVPTSASAASSAVAAEPGQPGDPNISFVGRWDTTSSSTAYTPYWAGAYFRTGFTGTTVKLKQRDTIDLWASVDGGSDVFYDDVSGTVDLAPGKLPAGDHTLRVHYQVVAGSYHGDAVFQGLELDGGATTFKADEPGNLIEFVGDSITVGTTTTQNASSAYGWLIGEQLGADHTQIAQGGACLVASSDGCVGLEQQFTRLNPNAATPDWDFSRYQATAVVINLGTNDVGHGVSSAQFQEAYGSLLGKVRAAYPNAWIFALKTFRERFVTETEAAVRAAADGGDGRVSFVDTSGWLGDGDMSDSVHPNDQGHRVIAEKLAPIVAAKLS